MTHAAERGQRTWLLALACMLVAALLRWPGLDAQSLWIDEIYSVEVTRWDVGTVLRVQDGHPPLYALLQMLVASLDYDNYYHSAGDTPAKYQSWPVASKGMRAQERPEATTPPASTEPMKSLTRSGMFISRAPHGHISRAPRRISRRGARGAT